MPISLIPLSFPESVDLTKFQDFGREVKGVHPGKLSCEEFKAIERALYQHDILLFRNVDLTPVEQYALIKAFDPSVDEYTHGNDSQNAGSILHSYLNALPKVPQVQILGHGVVKDHEGIPEITLKHGRHPEFHATRITDEDEAKGFTRFFRWHMDAALYDLEPATATALYGIKVPQGPLQTVRYDDGSGDELTVTLGTTALVSTRTMFNILPPEMKSLAVRARARYAPHAFTWMRNARAIPTGLGLESQGLEVPLEDLPAWDEAKVKTYPFAWKNPVTNALHLMVHPCAIIEMHVDPLPEGRKHEGALYPLGGTVTDLKEIRGLLYKMQRPGISPPLVYPHPWEEKTLILFNNRGLMHSVVGVFQKDHIRLFHQCNLAASRHLLGQVKMTSRDGHKRDRRFGLGLVLGI